MSSCHQHIVLILWSLSLAEAIPLWPPASCYDMARGIGGLPSCMMDRFCQGRNGIYLATLTRWDSYHCVCHFQVKATRQSVVSSSLDIANAQTIKQVDRNTSCTSYGLPVSVEIYPFDV